jgi:hypothetical protein
MQELIELFECVWDTVEASGELAKRPEGPWRSRAVTPVASASPLEQFGVSRYFETALAAAEKLGYKRVSSLLRKAAHSLVWSQNESYSEAKLGDHFMKNYATGLLTGPGAPFAREAPPSGFLLLGLNIEYPAHRHLPREVYLVLTPGTEWCLDGADWFSVAPGEVIYHSSNQSHAMRTQETPMLAFAAWLDSESRSAINI